MGIRENLVKLENRWSWSFFGFLLALIFGLLAIYSTFFASANPNLEFIVLSNTRVLDLNEEVKNLEIIYQQENIKQTNKNLSLIKVKAQNSGNADILNTYFDERSPVGIRIKNGRIVENPIITFTSNKYLNDISSVKQISADSILLPNLIIEERENIEFSLLVLHNENDEPKLESFGKIAGQTGDVPIILEFQNNKDLPFIKKITQGNILIHILRFFLYLLSIGLFMVLIVIPYFTLLEKISEFKRTRLIKKYIKSKELDDTEQRSKLFEMYKTRSYHYLVQMNDLISDKDSIKKAYDIHKRNGKNITTYSNSEQAMLMENQG